jgi:hypothetical protein
MSRCYEMDESKNRVLVNRGGVQIIRKHTTIKSNQRCILLRIWKITFFKTIFLACFDIQKNIISPRGTCRAFEYENRGGEGNHVMFRLQ